MICEIYNHVFVASLALCIPAFGFGFALGATLVKEGKLR